MTVIRIEKWNGGDCILVGTLSLPHMTAEDVDAAANEADGLESLVQCGDWAGPVQYEWTGDECYEVISEN